jgi:hypothetical protein
MPVTIDGSDIRIPGTIRHVNSISPPIAVTNIAQQNLQEYVLDLTSFRIWDAFQTNLPGTAATDDLALVGGTFATNAPSIQAGDLKAAGATSRYARFLVGLPPEYVAAQTLQLRFAAGMITTIADASCTLDVECHLSDEDNTVSADLCTTAAQDMNSVTFADLDFTINSTTLSPGDMLDVRITIACNDAATGTAVIPSVAAAKLLADTQG